MFYVYVKENKIITSSYNSELAGVNFDTVLTVEEWGNYKYIDGNLTLVSNMSEVDDTCFFIGVVDYLLLDAIDEERERSKLDVAVGKEFITEGNTEVAIETVLSELETQKLQGEITEEFFNERRAFLLEQITHKTENLAYNK